MVLGCNYSNELIRLINDNEVDLDYVKFPLEYDIHKLYESSRAKLPAMIHGIPVRTASLDLKSYDFDFLNHYLEKYNCPHFGIHFYANTNDFTETLIENEIKRRVEYDLEYFKEKVALPLLIENMPNYSITANLADATYLNKVCNKYDVGLLLDLSHAKITAHNLGIPFKEYINALPLSRVREIHVNGTYLDPKLGIRDKHYEMKGTDYNNLSYVLAVTNAKYLTLEYGGIGEHLKGRSNKDAIKRQIERLRTLIDWINNIVKFFKKIFHIFLRNNRK